MIARSRTTLVGLLARQFRADLGPLLAMAAIVLVMATLAGTAPLALRSMTSAEVSYQFDSLATARRDLLSRSPGTPPITRGDAPFAEFEASLADITASAPPVLRAALGKANFVVSTDALDVARLNVKWNEPLTPITLNATSDLARHVTLSEGRLPAVFSHILAPDKKGKIRPDVSAFERDPRNPSIEIAMSTKSANEAEWKIGEERLVTIDRTHGFYAKLVGTFDAIDPNDGMWAAARYTLNPGISATDFGGTNTRIVTSAAYIEPASWVVVRNETDLEFVTNVGIPFSVAGLSVEESDATLPQLRKFLSQIHHLTNSPVPGTVSSFAFTSDAEGALATALSRSSTTISVLVMVASGPIGVAIAVLWMLSRLIVLRRREALTLAEARGASSIQLRLSQALEVFAISLPFAAIGAVISAILFESSWSALSAILAGVVALLPAFLIAMATSRGSLRGTRSDLTSRSRGTYRAMLDIIVLALAALALTLLLQRGLTSNAETVAVDPLLAATPLLLALSAGLIVLRFYPLPLLGIAREAKRRKGIVSFLGASRSIRQPAAGLATVLAMVVGLAVAVFSGVMLGTVVGGVSSAAHSSVGADLRIDSPILSAQQVEQISTVDGVAESVSLYQYNRMVNLTVLDSSAQAINLPVPVIVVDTAALARVQRDVPDAAQIALTMSTTDGPIPVLLSPHLTAQFTIAKDSTLAGLDIVNAGTPGLSPSLSGAEDWTLIDVANSEALGIGRFLPRITLVSLDANADVSAVKAALLEIVGPDATIETPADATQLLNRSPVASGLQLALLALILIVALLCATTVVLALMINGPARERLLSLLRTLGLTRRQARGIMAWEITPAATIAVLAGLALGVGLPFIVLASVDLRSFTGGVLQPDVQISPLLVGAIIGGFILLVLLATAIALAAARRVNLARSLRTTEEG